MPHRLVPFLAYIKLIGGIGGLGGTVIAYAQFAVVDPDHLKLLMLAVGFGCLAIVSSAIKELIPLYVGARKQLRQMTLDLAAMDAKASDTDAKADRNAEDIEGLRKRHAAELAAAKEEVDRVKEDATEKRHKLRNQMNGRVTTLEADLLKSTMEGAALKTEVATLKRQLGVTDSTHARAINTVSSSVQEIAAHLEPPLDVETPHLRPTPDRPPAPNGEPANSGGPP
jgi:hypothetical protein